MYDWLRISTKNPDTWNCIEEHPLLQFDQTSRYGEILYDKVRYKHIDIERKYPSKTVWLGFSPHKLYNELHNQVNASGMAMNHDTFTPAALEWVLEWLKNTFAIQPETCQLHHLEFGLNLWGLSVPTDEILNSLIVYAYKGKQPEEMRVCGIGKGRVVKFSQYELKFYDKALQNRLHPNILRIEYKARKMQSIRKIFGQRPILADLLNIQLWSLCKNELQSVIDYCVFDDEFPSDTPNNEALTKWRNPREWTAMSPTNRSRDRKKFDLLIEQHGMLKIKQLVKLAIEKEFEAIMRMQ